MSQDRLHSFIQRLWNVVGPAEGASLPDADLVRRWVAARDPAAFEVLLWRHGPMVLGLCKRLLRSSQDAEDVFQSAFLALAMKADAIGKAESVGSWLYTVAYRAALQVRGSSERAEVIDPRLLDRLSAPSREETTARELRAALDEEVRRLPEKYRGAFVLCYLEGLTNEEASMRLGRPVGTVVSRLARARRWLRKRLQGRGLAPAAVVAVLTAEMAQAEVPARLAEVMTRTAALVAVGNAAGAVSPTVAALTRGILKTMGVWKMKSFCAIVLTVVLLGIVGSSLAIYSEGEQRAAQAEEHAARVAVGQARPARTSVATPTATPHMGGATPTTMPHTGGVPAMQHLSPTSATTSPADKVTDRKELLQQVRDEVEVLEAQLDVKRAQFQAAKAGSAAVSDRFAKLESFRKQTGGRVVANDDWLNAKYAASKAQADVAIREAEMREPMVRLVQARRRQAELEKPVTKPADRTQLRARLIGLEQRLDEIRNEIKKLRKELEPAKSNRP